MNNSDNRLHGSVDGSASLGGAPAPHFKRAREPATTPPTPTSAAFAYTGYDPSAPRIEIRGDLPIETVCLIDLLAFYVVRSGPTVEEEIIHREDSNPNFRFLTDSARASPENAYYRWRLYSLLQGDTMTTWRLSPFTMEKCLGAYVWVPPPPLTAGPASLHSAYHAIAQSSSAPILPPPASLPGMHEGDALDPAKPQQQQRREQQSVAAVYPVPSAYWLSRQLTGEGKAFGTLSIADAEIWTRMLDTNAILESEVGDTAESTKASSSAFEAAVQAASRALMSPDAIADKMVFAIERAQLNAGGAAPHLMSLLLDAMVKIAYDAAADVNGTPASTACATARQSPQQQQEGEEEEKQRTIRHAKRCVAQLAHLCTLHDIMQNVRAAPLLNDAHVDAAEAQKEAEEEQEKTRRGLEAALCPSRGSPCSPSNAASPLGTGMPMLPIPPVPAKRPGGRGGGSRTGYHSLSVPGAGACSPSLMSSSASTFGSLLASSTQPPRADYRVLSSTLAAIESILPAALEAVTLTAIAAVAGDAGGTAPSSHNSEHVRLQAVIEEDSGGIALGGGGLGVGGGLGGGGPRRVVAVSIPAATNGEDGTTATTASAHNGRDRKEHVSECEMAAEIGRQLLAWVSQLLCMWSNREYRGASRATAPPGRDQEPRGKPITLRGSLMVQLLDRYEWLLPPPS